MMKRIIDRLNEFDGWIGVIIGIVTVFAGIVGTLQVHAGNLNTNYRAETQRYSLDAMRIRSVGETMVSANLDYAARVDELLTQQNDLAELTGQTDAVATLSEAKAALAIISPAYGEPYASMGDKAAAAYEVDVYLRDATRAEQMRTFMQALDIPHDQINVNGGAIAMGHPLGATGAMILGTLLDELERRDLSTGLATLCVGAGMGTATIIERV